MATLPFLLLSNMDEPAFPGCVVEARLIGVIEAEQVEEGETVRHDRLVGVADDNHQYSDLKDIKDARKP